MAGSHTNERPVEYHIVAVNRWEAYSAKAPLPVFKDNALDFIIACPIRRRQWEIKLRKESWEHHISKKSRTNKIDKAYFSYSFKISVHYEIRTWINEKKIGFCFAKNDSWARYLSKS